MRFSPMFAGALGALGLLLSLPTTASAGDPKFEYGKKEEVKKVEWKAGALAGLAITTGNSRTTTGTVGAKASRKAGSNKFEAEANGAYARSSIFLANDADGSGSIDGSEVTRPAQTTTRAWMVKGRYDRFLTEHNSLYITAVASGDKPAGKDFVGGTQFGYSRQVYKDDKHEVKAEVGYDFSYENAVLDASGVAIHSARLFVGYEGTVTKDTGVQGQVESLHNVNSLDTAAGEVSAFEDTRVNSMVALTTKLFEDISFRFSFTAKYDHAPSRRPPFSIPYAADYVPLADELDTRTEATLIVNFL